MRSRAVSRPFFVLRFDGFGAAPWSFPVPPFFQLCDQVISRRLFFSNSGDFVDGIFQNRSGHAPQQNCRPLCTGAATRNSICIAGQLACPWTGIMPIWLCKAAGIEWPRPAVLLCSCEAGTLDFATLFVTVRERFEVLLAQHDGVLAGWKFQTCLEQPYHILPLSMNIVVQDLLSFAPHLVPKTRSRPAV